MSVDHNHTTFAVTIPNGGSLSNGVFTRNLDLFGILMPSAWTNAQLTFQVSDNGEDWYDLYDDTNEFSLPTQSVAADHAISGGVLADVFHAYNWIKVRSGTSAAGVNQGADRIIKLVCVQ